MQTGYVVHYMAEFLDNWFKVLIEKNPLAPMNAILTNYLYFPSKEYPDHSNLKIAAAELYNLVKLMEHLPDSYAAGETHNDPNTVNPNANILIDLGPDLGSRVGNLRFDGPNDGGSSNGGEQSRSYPTLSELDKPELSLGVQAVTGEQVP